MKYNVEINNLRNTKGWEPYKTFSRKEAKNTFDMLNKIKIGWTSPYCWEDTSKVNVIKLLYKSNNNVTHEWLFRVTPIIERN